MSKFFGVKPNAADDSDLELAVKHGERLYGRDYSDGVDCHVEGFLYRGVVYLNKADIKYDGLPKRG